MKNTKLTAVALLIATLPLAPAAFAHERGYDDDDYGRGHYERDYREQHWRQWHRYDRYERRYDHDRGYGYYTRGDWDYRPRVVAPQVVLPLPPLPPVPVIVLKKHHAATVELRRPY